MTGWTKTKRSSFDAPRPVAPDGPQRLRSIEQPPADDPRRSTLNEDYVFIDGAWVHDPAPSPAATPHPTAEHPAWASIDRDAHRAQCATYFASTEGQAVYDAATAEQDAKDSAAGTASIYETRLPLAPAAQQVLDDYMATVDPDELQRAHEDRQDRYMRALDPEYAAEAARRDGERVAIDARWDQVERDAADRQNERRKKAA